MQENDVLSLESVFGNSILHSSATSSASVGGGVVAYAAGCVVALYDPVRCSSTFIRAPEAKPIASLAFSPCGTLLAVGEKGHKPRILGK